MDMREALGAAYNYISKCTVSVSEAKKVLALIEAALASQQTAEPVAILCREIGETTWFDHQPLKPGSSTEQARQRSPEWDTCSVYTHAPTAQDSLPNEQGTNRYGLDMAYFRNLINRELNHSRGLHDYKPSELARVFARMAAAADRAVLQEPEFHPAQDSKGGVPEGYTLVPNEITLDMQRAYFDALDVNMKRVATDPRFGRFDNNRLAYRSMLSAAPVPDKPQPNAISEFFDMAEELENTYPFLYVEIARTRVTDWMAWFKDKPGDAGSVLSQGQASTPEEACRDALAGLQRPSAPGVE